MFFAASVVSKVIFKYTTVSGIVLRGFTMLVLLALVNGRFNSKTMWLHFILLELLA